MKPCSIFGGQCSSTRLFHAMPTIAVETLASIRDSTGLQSADAEFLGNSDPEKLADFVEEVTQQTHVETSLSDRARIIPIKLSLRSQLDGEFHQKICTKIP